MAIAKNLTHALQASDMIRLCWVPEIVQDSGSDLHKEINSLAESNNLNKSSTGFYTQQRDSLIFMSLYNQLTASKKSNQYM